LLRSCTIVSRTLGPTIEKFYVKIVLARATRLDYFSVSALIKYGSAWLGHLAAQLRLRLPGIIAQQKQSETTFELLTQKKSPPQTLIYLQFCQPSASDIRGATHSLLSVIERSCGWPFSCGKLATWRPARQLYLLRLISTHFCSDATVLITAIHSFMPTKHQISKLLQTSLNLSSFCFLDVHQ